MLEYIYETKLLNLILVLLIYIHQKGLIGFVILTKIILIHMVVSLLKNFLNLLQNEMVIVYIQNIRFEKMIIFVQVIVYI